MTAPCKDCPNRVLGCHDRCESYAQYRRHRETVRERALTQHEVNSYEREKYDKIMKRRHWNYE